MQGGLLPHDIIDRKRLRLITQLFPTLEEKEKYNNNIKHDYYEKIGMCTHCPNKN